MSVEKSFSRICDEVLNEKKYYKNFTIHLVFSFYNDIKDGVKIDKDWISDAIEEINDIVEIFDNKYEKDITLLLKLKWALLDSKALGLEKAISSLTLHLN